MMGGSGLIGFLQVLKGVGSGRPPRTTRNSSELARAASDNEDMLKDIATQMAGILAFGLSEDYRLPFGN